MHNHTRQLTQPVSLSIRVLSTSLSVLLFFSYMAECDSESLSESSLLPTKKSKRSCHFVPKWVQEFKGLAKSSKGKY